MLLNWTKKTWSNHHRHTQTHIHTDIYTDRRTAGWQYAKFYRN